MPGTNDTESLLCHSYISDFVVYASNRKYSKCANLLLVTTKIKKYYQYLQLPSISGHDCRSIGKLRNSIGHEALIVNRIEYKISPSCVSRSNLFGTVIVWMCECFPLKKYVSGRQMRSSIYHRAIEHYFEKFQIILVFQRI